MGFWDKLIRLRNTDTVETASKEERVGLDGSLNQTSESKESGDLKDRIPFRVNRTIPNFRYAFKYDPTVNSTINNLIVVANTKFTIKPESEEFEKDAKHIEEKCAEWNMSNFIDTFIKRNMIDGSAFINRYVKGGTLKLKYLSNDGKDFQWKVIRDPDTEEIIGFKQKVKKTKLPKNWKSADFDELPMEEEYDTITFEPEEIIYSMYMEENGQGVSALYSILDIVEIKGKLEQYMLLSGHKAGAFLGLKIGNDNVDSSSVDNGFINQVMEWFSNSKGKDVVAYPDGIEPNVIGNQNLPDYTTFVKFFQSEIRNTILTPDSKFSSTSSNRNTADVQMTDSTGYQGFIEYLQDFVSWYINTEIIDKELELFNSKAVGKVKLVYENDKTDDETALSDVGTMFRNAFPDANGELIIRTYYPRYAKQMDEYKRLYGDEWEKKLDKEMGKMPMGEMGGTDGQNLWSKPGMNSYNENMHNSAVNNKKKKVEETTGKDVYKEV